MPVSGPLFTEFTPGRVSPTGKFSAWLGTETPISTSPGSPPVPITSYFLSSTTGSATLVTPSFTPDVGEIIVVKATGEGGGGGGSGLPIGTGLTFTKHQEINTGTLDAHAVIWSAVVGSSTAMTITVNNNTATNWSTVVERWPVGTTLGTVVLSSGAQGSGTPLATLTTTAANSTISWASADWFAVAPGSPVYRDSPVQEAIHDRSPSNYVAYYAYQAVPTAGATSFGLTSPGGQKWSAVGLEIKAAPGSTPPQFGSSGTHISGNATTANFPVPAGVATGDIIVIPIFLNVAATTITAMPTDFAHAEGSPIAVGTSHSLAVVWKRATGADAGTYDFTLSTNEYRAGAAHRYTGCITSGSPWETPTDTAFEDTSATVTPAVDITTTGANRLLIFSATNWAGGAWTPPTGFTKRMDTGDRVHTLADNVQASAGATGSITATCAGSDKRVAWLGALKPTATGGGGPTTVPVNQVTETDTAQPVRVLRSRTVVQVTETDTPQAIAKIKIKAVLQAPETDTPQAITRRKIKTVLQTVETDTAQSITRTTPVRMVNQITETDTAQPITRRKIKLVGQVIETDSTQTITRQHRRTLGQPIETDTVTSITKRKIKSVGQTIETDSAQRITIQGRVFQVTETDTAQPITRRKIKTVNQITETDTVTPITRRKVRTVGQTVEIDTAALIIKPGNKLILLTSEIDTAQKITVIKRKTLGQLIETDLATVITPRRTRRFNMGLAQEVDTVTALRSRKLVHVIQVTETDLARIINFSSVLPPPPDGPRVTVVVKRLTVDVVVTKANIVTPSTYITDVIIAHADITVVP